MGLQILSLFVVKISPQCFLTNINPNTWAWVLENGFSIEAGAWDLISNLFLLN